MPNYKKHHYVPRFYLRRFSRDKKSIGVLNIKKGLVIRNANLYNQCYKDYFYGKDKKFEMALGGIEEGAVMLLKKIDKANCLPPPLSDDHFILIICVLLQHSRTIYAADSLNEMNDKMMKHVFREKVRKDLDCNIDDFIIAIENASQHSVGLVLQLYPTLLDLDYILLLNTTRVDFITSDNPVVMINPFMSFITDRSTTGLASKGLIIFFPISPRQVILFFDTDVYRVGKKSDYAINIHSNHDIENINAIQGCACYENIYFFDDNFGSIEMQRKVKPFRRKEKTQVKVFHEVRAKADANSYKRELMMTCKEDIRFKPKLSFLNIRTSAKAWREKILKSKKRMPSVFLRNSELIDDHEKFMKLVDDGKYNASDFLTFARDKYSESR